MVFTNDRERAAECLKGAARAEEVRYVTELGSFSDKEEFLLLSACRNQILSNSSYSAWAAYLNRNPGQVVFLPSYEGAKQLCLPGWELVAEGAP